MNRLGQIQRQYDRLNVWERVPLLLAARTRGDDAEHRRLKRAAPRLGWQIPEFAVAEHTLHILTMEFIQQQMEFVGNFFFTLWYWSDAEVELTEEQADSQDYAVESLHHFFAINARGWEQFCRGLGVDPAALIKSNHFAGRQSIFTEKLLETAPDEQEFIARAAARGEDTSSLTTAARTTFWRGQLRKMTRGCPVPESLLRTPTAEAP